MGLRYRDLGPVGLDRDGTPVKVPAGRLTTLLSVLLVQANHRVSIDGLLDALWGEHVDGQNVQTLESHVSRLRKLLEPQHQPGRPYSTVLHNAQGYQLLAANDQVDSLWLEQLAGQARDLAVSGQPERALSRCEQALGLWRGQPWAPHSEQSWAAPAAARLQELRAGIAEQRIDALLELGQIPLALADLQVLIGESPLRERLWGQRMLGLHRAGRTDDALQAYQQLRELLVDELGVDPGSQIRELHARILADDPGLAATVGRAEPGAVVDEVATGPHSEGGTVLLPNRRTALIGRAQHTADLAALILTRRLVSVVGTAGCGKTSIAVEAARDVAQRFPDGVVFIDLSAATEQDQLLDTVSSTLRLRGSAAESLTQSLVAFTRSRRMLLILDNCEQLLEEVADLADVLLGIDTELNILITSREPLNLDDEQIFDLRPLPVLDDARTQAADIDTLAGQAATTLFLTRLNASAPDLAIGQAETRLAAQICAAVDGVPLAIELAAAQARAYSLAEILDRVRDDLAGLARIGRGANRHHHSLRAAIDLSAAALPDDERAMHHALSVVSGPVTPALAAALVGQPQPAAQLTLSRLVHRSMLTAIPPERPDAPTRFAQLATIRSHAHTALPPQRRTELENRRDAWVHDLIAGVPRLGGARRISWQNQVDDDLTAVRATLQRRLVDDPAADGVFLAARLAWFWYDRGMVSEWERWTRLAHALADQADPVDHLLTGLSYASVRSLMGRTDHLVGAIDAVEAAPQELTRAEQLLLGDNAAMCIFAALAIGDATVASQAEATVRHLAQRANDADLLLLSEACQVGNPVFAGQADLKAALRETQRLWDTSHQTENSFLSWVIATGGAVAALMAGDPAMALLWSNRVLTDFPRTGGGGVSLVLEMRAAALTLNASYLEAVQVFSASRSHARRAGLPWPLSPTTQPSFTAAANALSTHDREQAEHVGTHLALDEVVHASEAPA